MDSFRRHRGVTLPGAADRPSVLARYRGNFLFIELGPQFIHLLDSELSLEVRTAFSGAANAREGLREAQGSLVLKLSLQIKLLPHLLYLPVLFDFLPHFFQESTVLVAFTDHFHLLEVLLFIFSPLFLLLSLEHCHLFLLLLHPGTGHFSQLPVNLVLEELREVLQLSLLFSHLFFIFLAQGVVSIVLHFGFFQTLAVQGLVELGLRSSLLP